MGCQMQVPSWPRWRARTPLFSVPNHEGSHMDDASDPPWEQRTASTNGRRHAGARHCSGGAVLKQKNSHVKRKFLLLADWIRVPTCSWSRKRTSSNCSTLPSACAVAQGPLPPREEDPPRNSAKRNRHKKVLPRVTCTTHRVLTAVQPARRRDDTRKKKACEQGLGRELADVQPLRRDALTFSRQAQTMKRVSRHPFHFLAEPGVASQLRPTSWARPRRDPAKCPRSTRLRPRARNPTPSEGSGLVSPWKNGSGR